MYCQDNLPLARYLDLCKQITFEKDTPGFELLKEDI
jgi:hypothetical protein